MLKRLVFGSTALFSLTLGLGTYRLPLWLLAQQTRRVRIRSTRRSALPLRAT